MSSQRITIFDTTLRDGEQSPGASMNTEEKIGIAKALVDLGVDVIEAGFPIASPGDYEAVRLIAEQVRGARICGLARCRDADIDRAGAAIAPAEAGRIHVFLATSAIHRERKLKMGKEEIVERAVAAVKRARNLCDDVEFSPEDAGRTEDGFLCEVVEAAIAAGATTVNIPDTVGYCMPAEYAGKIRVLFERVPNIDRAVVSVHCHNDLGVAVANTLAAIEAGARQVECTINGIGERAGNCSLEEVVMALRTRSDAFGGTAAAGVHTEIDTRRLVPVSRMVSHITGLQVQRNKAIVGKNAFAHEAGIHQDGMLKDRTTYEIMRPEDVGIARTELVLGKHSGRHALRQRVQEMGYDIDGAQLDEVFRDFKELCDKKKEVFDADLEALVDRQLHTVEKAWKLVTLHTSAGSSCQPCATVTLQRPDGTQVRMSEFGCGPIDAAFNTIEKITGYPFVLTDFNVRSVTTGKDAQAEVYVEIRHDGRVWRARASSTDTVEASAYAMVGAVNRIVRAADRTHAVGASPEAEPAAV